MIRVTCNRRGWQLPILATLGLAAALLVGCGPGPAQPKPEKKAAPAAKPQAEETPAKPEAEKAPAKPQAEVPAKPQAEKPPQPAAKSPVYDPPTVEVDPKVKEPVGKPPAKVPAATPQASKGTDEAPAADAHPHPRVDAQAGRRDPGGPGGGRGGDEALQRDRSPARDVKFDMVPIRGGKFLMGSPDSEKGHQADEGPQHEVARRAVLDGEVRGHLGRVRALGPRARQGAPQASTRSRRPTATR